VPPPAVAALSTLNIYVTSANEELSLGVDEDYTLTVTAAAAGELRAATVFGALKGLETFSQLVSFTRSTGQYRMDRTPLSIDDGPRFPWRGMLIDTSRHYLSLETIRTVIDALAFNKMNVLHWHIIDAQSFPLVSATYPRLSDMGAWDADLIYTRADIEALETYAQYRGVRIVPEFDTPGHTRSWGYGYPELMADCINFNPFTPALNPLPNSTYEFVENLFREMTGVFKDDFIHVGGDELAYSCWAQDASIRAYVAAERITLKELFRRYWFRLQDIVVGIGRRSVAWEEVFTDNLNPPLDGVIQVWIDKATLTPVVEAGYDALLSAGWYLDRQLPVGDSSTHYMMMDTWIDFYRNEPCSNLTDTQCNTHVMGGEACMWGEQVDNFSIHERMWPRAAAVAERLWSPRDVRIVNTARFRLNRFRCRLAANGINSHPIYPSPPCLIP
jgi:hexosaminidase